MDGCIDAITSSGYVEGWAYDSAAPLRPLTLSVVAGDREIARGLANLYRWDLADAGCGTGWCAFRLRLSGSVSRLRRQRLSLWDSTQETEIHRAQALPVAEDHEPGLSALQEVIAADPTLVHAIEQLRGCGAVFANFIAEAGVDEFVRAAFAYILARPADHTGLTTYTNLLKLGSLTPHELLRTLYESEEFQSAPRQLIAPPEPGFVFQRS